MRRVLSRANFLTRQPLCSSSLASSKYSMTALFSTSPPSSASSTWEKKTEEDQQDGVKTRYTHFMDPSSPVVSSRIAPVMSAENATSKQQLSIKKREMMEQFKQHDLDTGSSQVQIAILTERIISLAKHFAVHKKDKSGYRGYLAAIQKRKRLMLHLKRHNPEEYKRVVIEKNLFKEAEQLAKYKK